jgi:hypothetical protein
MRIARLTCCLALALTALWGCLDTEDKAGGPAEEVPAGATLALTLASSTPEEVVVDLHYTRVAGQLGPRMMELFLEPSAQLNLLGSEGLGAVLAAQKQLVVQEAEAGSLRVVVYSAGNLNELQSGPLARFRFQAPKDGSVTLKLLDRRPLFAPADADRGTTLGDPLVISSK